MLPGRLYHCNALCCAIRRASSLHLSLLCHQADFIIALLIVVLPSRLYHCIALYCAIKRASSLHCSCCATKQALSLHCSYCAARGALSLHCSCCATKRALSLHYSCCATRQALWLHCIFVVPSDQFHHCIAHCYAVRQTSSFMIHLLIDWCWFFLLRGDMLSPIIVDGR